MRQPATFIALILLTLLITGSLFSLTCGAVSISPKHSILLLIDTIWDTHFSALTAYQKIVILDLRLPRLLLAIFIGATLAQCGAVMQGLFRNPLADPGIIGVSAGSAVGAIGAITLLPKEWQPWSLSVCAFASGLISALLVYGLTVSKRGTSVLILLLSGVALSAFSGAAIGLMSYFANNQNLRELTVWQMGSLSGANATSLWITGSCMLVLAILFQLKSRTLNLLLLGESEARHLGVSVESLKIQLILLTAIGVGVSVASAGIIGFIGLVIPHLIRMLTGPNHVSLLPLSALLGATLLVISDGVARIIMPPIEFPVGLITALLGAPFFLVLLIRQRKAWG